MRAIKFLLIVFISTTVWAATQPAERVMFKPSLDQRLRSNLATKFLANWHYKDTSLDDECWKVVELDSVAAFRYPHTHKKVVGPEKFSIFTIDRNSPTRIPGITQKKPPSFF